MATKIKTDLLEISMLSNSIYLELDLKLKWDNWNHYENVKSNIYAAHTLIFVESNVSTDFLEINFISGFPVNNNPYFGCSMQQIPDISLDPKQSFHIGCLVASFWSLRVISRKANSLDRTREAEGVWHRRVTL